MSERTVLKSRLAAEVANVVFGDGEVPSSAWGRLDGLVEESFGEISTERLRTLVDDVGELRARDGSVESSDLRNHAPRIADEEWETLQEVIDDVIIEYDPDRYRDADDEASGARTLETVSHGR